MQEQEFDPGPACRCRIAPASLTDICSLVPALLFLRMLCSGLIASKLFLVFKLTRKTRVYSVLNYFSPSLMFVYTEISLGPCWSFHLANAVRVKRALRGAPSARSESGRGVFCLPFDGLELLPELSIFFDLPSVCKPVWELTLTLP